MGSMGEWDDHGTPQTPETRLSRRSLLKGAVGGVAALGLTGALAACGGSDATEGATVGATTTAGETTQEAATTAAAETSAADAPVRGGTLRVGMVGGGTSATLDPASTVTNLDIARYQQLYEQLVDPYTNPEDPFVLAESLEPNADLTEWQIKLRPGVTFHDGKPLTADDVLYTYRRLKTLGAAVPSALDLKRSRRVSDSELVFALNYPVADVVPAIVNSTTYIVQDGAEDFSAPVGTGPFAYESFQPGQESVFARYDGYWQNGLPYVDAVQITEISDPAARLNALLAGQADVVSELDPRVAEGLVPEGTDKGEAGIIEASDGKIRILNTAAAQTNPMCMNLAAAPFTDSRVTLAFKLAMNREECIGAALAGWGVVGNDLYGLGRPDYNTDLAQHEYDPEQARSLLKQAGMEGLKIEFPTAPAGVGFVESAQVFASSAKAAGIDVTIRNTPADSYYTDIWTKVPLFQTSWINLTLLQMGPLVFLETAQYAAETNWKRPEWDAKFIEAQGTADDTLRKELLFELQAELWKEGGYLIWGYNNLVDGLGANVRGVEPGVLNLDFYNFKEYWLAS